MRCIKLTTLFTASIFAAIVAFIPASRAYAFFGCVPTPPVLPTPLGPNVLTYDGATALQQTFSNTYLSSNYSKECIADALVTFLGKAMIRNLTGSIVDWINNDFEGGPAFVTNPQGFFVNIADEAAGNFIENRLGPLGQLICSPFDLQLRLNLWLSTSASHKQYIGCRLSDIEKNAYNAFTNGGFIVNGGWNTFHSMTSDPRNNQFGAFIYASDALNTDFIKKANEKLRELSYGKGFLSFNKCVKWSEGAGSGTGEDAPAGAAAGSGKVCTEYKTETPGSLIENNLSNVLGSDLKQLEIADEINEVFQSMVNFGLRQVFSSAGGLRSTGVRVANNRPPIIQNLIDSTPEKVSGEIITKNNTATTTKLEQMYTEIAEQDKTSQSIKNTSDSQSSNTRETQYTNLAYQQQTSQSGFKRDILESDKAVNGDTVGYTDDNEGRYFEFAAVTTKDSMGKLWWKIIFQKQFYISDVRIYKATNLTSSASLGTLSVSVYDSSGSLVKAVSLEPLTTSSPIPVVVQIDAVGQSVQINRVDAANDLSIAEVQVYGAEDRIANGNNAAVPRISTTAQVTVQSSTQTAPIPAQTVKIDSIKSGETANARIIFRPTNMPISSGTISITVKRKVGTIPENNVAIGTFFDKFIINEETNGETPIVRFEEGVPVKTLASENAQPIVISIGSNSGNRSKTIDYEFIPSSGAIRSDFRIITEIKDNGVTLNGGAQEISFPVQ